MMDLMVGLAKKHHQTMIIVTHALEISVYADRIIHLMDGKVDEIRQNDHKITNSKQLSLAGQAKTMEG